MKKVMKADEIVLDIETRKVPTPEGFKMPSGEPMRRRWQAFLIGVGFANGKDLIIESDSEEELFNELTLATAGIKTIYYAATREFDEMILKGRFTNARRAHLPRPGNWPRWKMADRMTWINVKKIKVKVADRSGDVASRDVPWAWKMGDRAGVRSHLLRDLEDLRATVAQKK